MVAVVAYAPAIDLIAEPPLYQARHVREAVDRACSVSRALYNRGTGPSRGVQDTGCYRITPVGGS